MAFTALGAILGLGSSILGGAQQRSAAQEANKLAEQIAKKQYRRAVKEWRIDYLNQKSNFLYQLAQTEALRFAERQKKADFETRNKQLIASALQNLEVNREAINDKFITEENLRARQVGLDYGYKMNQLSDTAIETVRQYMIGVQDTQLQSKILVNETQRQGQELLSNLVFEQERDNLQWDIAQISAVIDQAQVAANASVRMGGSGSSERLALNVAQKLGQSWGQMDLQMRSRDNRVGLWNRAMQGEIANNMARMALSIQDSAEKIKFTGTRYAADTAYETNVFRDLTIPSFRLAARQGAREMKSLQIQTQSVLNEASLPYRESIIFDPIKPIRGLKPEYLAPTQSYVPSLGGIIGNAVLSGVNSAISLGSFTKADGSLGFR